MIDKPESKHYSYKSIVGLLAGSDWGRNYENDEAAQRSMLGDVGITDACLLALFSDAKQVLSFLSDAAKSFIEAAVDKKLNQYSDRLIDRHDEMLTAFAKDRGVCVSDIPSAIQDYFWSLVTSEVGEGVCEGYLCTLPGPYQYKAPPKKSPVYAEYKKWMASLRGKKRKAAPIV